MTLIVFDIDGVLIDSLPAHLKFCQDLADQHNLGLIMPDESAFKQRITEGMICTPMPLFFKALGFPEEKIDIYTEIYKQSFTQNYVTSLYEGAGAMLKALNDAGFRLGVVTANIKENIIPGLGELYEYFDDAFCHFYDPEKPHITKADILSEYKTQIGQDNIVFIGDQYSDEKYAKQAGVKFIPVTYGWAFSELSDDPEHCHTVDDLQQKLLLF